MKRFRTLFPILTLFVVTFFFTMRGLASVGTGNTVESPDSTRSPTITSVSTAGFWAGEAFNYQITATNGPTGFNANGLPNGLTLNATNGEITGTVMNASAATVQLTATNQYGSGTMNLALTPANSPNLVGTSTNCAKGVTAPPAAAASNYGLLAFCDDFDSISTIDQNETGTKGYNWYVRRPWDVLPPTAYSVRNSMLTLADSVYNNNWGLTSADIKTRSGHAFSQGYFEARINFNPMLGTSGPGWPSFWSLSANLAETWTTNPYAELDFFEAFPQTSPGPYYGVFGGTLHDWRYSAQTGYTDYLNPRNIVATGLDWTQWHTVGCLWIKGQVTWYLDGNAVMTQLYSASTEGNPTAANVSTGSLAPVGVFTDLDSEPLGMLLILGSGPSWPINVDWVRVWQH